MKEINVKKLLRVAWIFAILTMCTLPFIRLLAENLSEDDVIQNMLVGSYGFLVILLGLASIGFLNGISGRLTPKQKKPFLILTITSGLLFLFFAFLFPLSRIPYLVLETITFGLLGVFVLACIYSLTCYLGMFDRIFIGLFSGIVAGLILNRIGIGVAGFFVGLFCFLSFYGFLFHAILHLRKSKEHKQFRRMVALFCFVNSLIFLLLFFKFSSDKPAFTKSLDAIGVVIFLFATIALFISMPFSNFMEWLKSERQTFYKVILLPFLFYLVVFSLTFLLPDSTYRKIFFIEYSKTEKVHFWMEDYESDID